MTNRPEFCFVDIDIDGYRRKLALAAAFVHATDTRYGFSSKDLRQLGGSELSRIEELISNDHEWSPRVASVGGSVSVRPPLAGNRIIVKLFWHVAPLACENFSTLCRNSQLTKPPLGECGKPLSYTDSNVHRIVPGFILQGGDFVFGNGSGGESVFHGRKFKDEKAGLVLRHDRRGMLSMGNAGKHANTSQFFLTFGPAPQCNGKHVVFGELVSGWEVLTAAEQVGTPEGVPSVPVTVTRCGPYTPLVDPPAGHWFDRPDQDSYAGVTPVFVCRPRVLVLAPNKDVAAKFTRELGATVTLTCLSRDDADVDVAARIVALLRHYAVDVVLVAPACQGDAPTALPPAWTELRDLRVNDVILVSKPVDSKLTLKQSWITTTTWQLSE